MLEDKRWGAAGLVPDDVEQLDHVGAASQGLEDFDFAVDLLSLDWF